MKRHEPKTSKRSCETKAILEANPKAPRPSRTAEEVYTTITVRSADPPSRTLSSTSFGPFEGETGRPAANVG
ncbi:hypothetical protein BU26DRAFT_523173, partial [Trematosphaeria pertusa]